jgi:hypothetical protein
MIDIGRGIASACAFGGAAWMAVNGVEGWGWLVFVGFLIIA